MVAALAATNDDGNYQTPSKRQLSLFRLTNKATDGPQLDPFLLDLNGPTTETPWNKRAAYVFADHFVEQPDIICTDAKVVREVFRAHLRALAKEHRFRTADPQERDTMVERAQRENVYKAKDHRQRIVSSLSHFFINLMFFSQLRERRADVCRIFYEKLPNSKSLKLFHSIWKRMPKEACSEDEAFVRDGKMYYRKIRLPWRSTAPDVVEWFKTFDHLHMSTRFQANGKRQRGRLPRHRFPASTSGPPPVSGYPKGLPSNFYDQTWLETLDDFEKRQLKVKKAINLSFDDNVKA